MFETAWLSEMLKFRTPLSLMSPPTLPLVVPSPSRRVALLIVSGPVRELAPVIATTPPPTLSVTVRGPTPEKPPV